MRVVVDEKPESCRSCLFFRLLEDDKYCVLADSPTFRTDEFGHCLYYGVPDSCPLVEAKEIIKTPAPQNGD